MKSLVVVSSSPRSRAGGAPLRNLQSLHALSSLGAVDVISIGVPDTPEPLPDIREWASFPFEAPGGWRRFAARWWPLCPGRYPMVDAYRSSAVARLLTQWIEMRGYDLVVLETLLVTSYMPTVKRSGGRVVYDAHNAEAALQRSVLAGSTESSGRGLRRLRDRLRNRRLAQIEGSIVRAADMVWTCSEVDAAELAHAYRPAAPIHVVPNGVDVDVYRRPGALAPHVDWPSSPITIVYSGSFAYPPNEAAAFRLIREVLPALRARGVDTRVVLVGREPSTALLSAGAADHDVQVTGAVPSVLPYLERPCLVALPIDCGSGTRLKTLEAFAVGRPVVSTAKGVEGIAAVDGVHLLVREDSPAIADAVIALWRDRDLRARICASALDLVQSTYSWSAAARTVAACLDGHGSAHPPVAAWCAQRLTDA